MGRSFILIWQPDISVANLGRGRKETNYWYYKNMHESQRHYAEWKKPVSKGQTLYDSIYMTFWKKVKL